MIDIINNLNALSFLDDEKSLIRRKLIHLLFREISNLQSFCLNTESEYNDNNYYNSVILESINDVPLEPHVNEYYKDDLGNVLDSNEYSEEEGKPVDKSKVLSDEELSLVSRVVNSIGEEYSYGHHEFKREEYNTEISLNNADYEALLYKNKLDRNTKKQLKEDDPIVFLYYSSMGNKLSKKQERCFKDNMEYAYYYAKYILKGRLPNDMESYLRLNIFKKDYVSDKDKFYLELYNNFASNK